jgi:hypothetical protein
MSAEADTPCVERALTFLRERQRESGQFQILVGLELEEGKAVDDPSIFATTLIGRALAESRSPEAREVRRGAAEYVRLCQEGPGLWRHWTREHAAYSMIPSDSDDAACVCALLTQEGLAVPDTRRLLLANRDREGRFFSWFIVRWPPPPLRVWPFLARTRLRHPLAARRFWTGTPSDPDDVDAVVNAHVLAYVGDGEHAPAVVAYLLGVLDRYEEPADKWYASPRFFYNAVARAAEVVPALDAARETICARIKSAASPNGEVGGNALETALALGTLARWRAEPELRARAALHLENTQRADGSWPIAAAYKGQKTLWGSSELTTGLCIEALLDHARAEDKT